MDLITYLLELRARDKRERSTRSASQDVANNTIVNLVGPASHVIKNSRVVRKFHVLAKQEMTCSKTLQSILSGKGLLEEAFVRADR